MPSWNFSDYFGEMKPYDGRPTSMHYYQQDFGPYQPIPYQKDMCLLVPGGGGGFLQSEKYFIDYKKEVVDLLFPKIKKKFPYEE